MLLSEKILSEKIGGLWADDHWLEKAGSLIQRFQCCFLFNFFVFLNYLGYFEFINVGLEIFPVIVRKIFASFTGPKANRKLQIHLEFRRGRGNQLSLR